jgi:uncharacterized protein (DUF2336 family)
MAAAASTALIGESVGAAKGESRHAQVLRQVADLFVSNAVRFDETRISLFDDVFLPLIERAETTTLAHLSAALSEIDLAPRQTVRRLAFHQDVSVAAPVLAKSSRLSEQDLIEIVNTGSQQHLLAIAGRQILNEALTDTLIRRGDVDVSNAVARNGGACFSECGYATLVGRAERDENLTEKLGLRWDIPAKLLRELLEKATDVVRARFLTASRPALQPRVQGAEVVAEQANAVPPKPIDYTEAQSEVATLNRTGKLNDPMVNRFAVRREYVKVVAALSFMSEVKIEAIEPLIRSDRLYGLVVACKASRLNWTTTRSVIDHRPGCPPVSQQELERGLEIFESMLLSVAQWTIRFGSDRLAAKQNNRSEPK